MNNSSCEINKYSELNKKYRIIAFDWDGTAVHHRKEEIPELINAVKELLKQGVYIVVITGTNFDNIDKQFSSHIVDRCKKYLYICTNRGSEVFGFDDNSQLVQLYGLLADSETNKLLDEIVEKTKQDIEDNSKENLLLNIIYDRLNRRKLDLIPEWKNPLKSEIDKLIAETQKKLIGAGFEQGIKGAFDLMQKNAKLLGMKDARITSDVKHIEIGISDKSDSVKWILENLSKPNNISDDQILILGDEFGTVAGFDGSDYKMVLQNHEMIVYFSVGKEPNGLPSRVKHIGGAPECFLKIIKSQKIK